MKDWMKKTFNLKELKSIIVLVLIVFAFRSTFFEPFRIPSGSMIPTLNIGDFILVNKFSYGFKIPYSDMFTNPIYITEFESPKRYDVVVFKYPVDPNINFIKRVVGVPGDEIEMINKVVYVNGVEVKGNTDLTFDTNKFAKSFDNIPVNFFNFKDDKANFYFQNSVRETPADTVPKFTVPEGHYFMLGDNRDFSADSRYWGFVPKENIKGKALLVWMSMTLPFLDKGFSFSPTRIGNMIH